MEIVQDIIVAVIVACSAIFSTWRLLTPQRRLWLLGRLPAAWRRSGWLARRENSARIASLSSGCSTCSHNHAARVHHPAAQRQGGK